MSEFDAAEQLKAMVAAQAVQPELMSEEAATRAAILGLLGTLGSKTVKDDAIQFTGSKIVLPEAMNGRIPEAISYLRRYWESQEKEHRFNRVFKYRPHDGAHAFQNAMYKMFGSAGLGQVTPATMFSAERPPAMITIEIGVGQTTQVPWDRVAFPPLSAMFVLTSTTDPELGPLFYLVADAPKKYATHINGLFDLIDQELRENSIYKGKAINGSANPGYVDVSRLDPARVVYSQSVLTHLQTHLWSLLDHTDMMRRLKLPLKRSVLVEGPYGTGKTLAGMLTAMKAVENGWTYILCRPGKDDLYQTLTTAQLYAPAVVWFEDIDTLAKGGTDEDISKLLDALDGIQGKGAEVVAGFTTNFVERLQKGTLRPGRIDAIIRIEGLDRAGFQKMVEMIIPADMRGDIDYEKVAEAFDGYLPAFVKEAIDGALRYAIARTNGNPHRIETMDLVNSGEGLRRQYELMSEAAEGADVPTVDGLMRSMISRQISNAVFEEDTNGLNGLRVTEGDREFLD